MVEMPNGWREVTIGQLGRVITGKTPPTKNHELFGDEYPFITPTDIEEQSRKACTERFLSEEGCQKQKNSLLPAGAVCFTCIGATIGKMCMTTRPSFTNQQINSVVVDHESHDPRYVYYLLRQQAGRIKSLASGAATPIVNKSTFSGVEVSVPPLSTQRKVASVLSAYDDLIENNARRIEILEEMAQAIYREWFVNFRFPGHDKAKMVDSELGPIPKRWEVSKLGDVCTVIMGQSPKSEYYNDKGQGLPFHQGVRDFGPRFPTDRLYCTIENRTAEAGDILFSVRAPVGRINLTTKKMVIGRGLSAIRSKSGNQAFTFQQLKDRFQEEDSMGGGTIFKAVTKSDMLGIKIVQPEATLVERFESVVTPMFRELENLTAKNNNLRRTRDLLLSKLISGEVDVEEHRNLNAG
jgi:type I restriction enzyme S subunit